MRLSRERREEKEKGERGDKGGKTEGKLEGVKGGQQM